jgi:hypothetical protein
MKAEDLIKKNPYSLRICEKQSYLMGLGNIKDYEILHDGLAIRKLTMSESDATEIVKLLNYAFINGVTQSILSKEEKPKKVKTPISVKGSVNGTDGDFYSKGTSNLEKPNTIQNAAIQIDGELHISIGSLIKLGLTIPTKGALVQVSDSPFSGYVARRVFSDVLVNKSFIFTSPFATEVGKRIDPINLVFISVFNIGSKDIKIDKGFNDKGVKFSMDC